MSTEDSGALKALKAERAIRRQAQANNNRLADDLAKAQLSLTKLGAENKRFRADNHRLTEANRKLVTGQRGHTEQLRRRDQTINALRVQLADRGIPNE